MSPPTLNFHASVAREILTARRWYARRSPVSAGRFATELDLAFDAILAAPGQGTAHLLGTRFRRVKGFPYLVIYKETPTLTKVIAVAHTSRRPGYWRRRLP